MFFRNKPYKHKRLHEDVLHQYVRLYGSSCWNYLNLNNAFYHYEVAGTGVVTYAWTRGILRSLVVVACDPLCSDEDLEELLGCFHRDVKGVHIYLMVSKQVADVLHRKFGFYKTQACKDYYCDFAEWKPPKKRGKKKCNWSKLPAMRC